MPVLKSLLSAQRGETVGHPHKLATTVPVSFFGRSMYWTQLNTRGFTNPEDPVLPRTESTCEFSARGISRDCDCTSFRIDRDSRTFTTRGQN
jgi:hypothetical protein